MTAIAMKREYQGFHPEPGSTGSSESAFNIASLLKKAIDELSEPVTWHSRLEGARTSLLEVFDECSKPNWDGYNATPISPLILSEAMTFIDALPSWVPLPTIVPEPDGSIAFEWYGGKNRVFIASVSGNNTVVYAGLLGKGNRKHGVVPFNDSIPTDVIEGVNQVLGQRA